MATSNSTTNLITMSAQNDTARPTGHLKLAGVIAMSTSVTAAPYVELTDTAGKDIVGPIKAKSGAGILFDHTFRPPLEVVGLKAAHCSNAAINIHLA